MRRKGKKKERKKDGEDNNNININIKNGETDLAGRQKFENTC